nr:hypothetical protein [uncultured Methylophaga sp.]
MKIETHGLNCQIEFAAPDREGWQRAKVNIAVPNFNGSFVCELQSEEIEYLRQQLLHLESQLGKEASIEWQNLEDNIFLSLKLDRQGNIEGVYKFSANVISIGPTLSGEFNADQSYLIKWANQLKGVASVGS